MITDLLKMPPEKLPDGYPFHIGMRYIHTVDAEGRKTSRSVPLTEEDFLHPQEGDRFILTDSHSAAVFTLRHAISTATRNRPLLRVFSEHRVDWQVGNIKPHGPDLVVFDQFAVEWDQYEGTLPVGDVGAKVLAVFEVTSEATRHIDLGAKFEEYEIVGIPYYLVVDTAAPPDRRRILGFELARNGFREMTEDAKLGFLVPGLNLWVRWQNDRVYVAEMDGQDILDPPEMADQLIAEHERAEVERERAEVERERADRAEIARLAEQQRADAAEAAQAEEKRRADEAERRLRELLATAGKPANPSGESPR